VTPTPAIPAPPPAARVPADEIEELFTLVDYRPAVIDEALAQCNGFLQYYSGLLMFSRSSHRYTFLLANFAVEAGTFFAMHFKHRRYGGLGPRPRPSQLCPWLLPPIAVPGHASYPSGHATQSMLLSLLLSNVMPDAVRLSTINPVTGAFGQSLLLKLAERIGRNREVLGLHYPTDSAAGRMLATQVYQLLAPINAKMTAVAAAQTAVDAANAVAGALGTANALAFALAAVDAATAAQAVALTTPPIPADAATTTANARITVNDIVANAPPAIQAAAANATLTSAQTTLTDTTAAGVATHPTQIDTMITNAQGEWS